MSEKTSKTLLEEFLDALGNLEIDRCTSLLAEDAVLIAPLAPEGIPPRTEGREAIGGLFGMLGTMFNSFTWTARDLHATEDPELAVGTGSATIELVNGQPYLQDFAFFLRVRGGEIVEYTEFMDPIRAGKALASLQA